jgi:hypothetical protein
MTWYTEDGEAVENAVIDCEACATYIKLEAYIEEETAGSWLLDSEVVYKKFSEL